MGQNTDTRLLLRWGFLAVGWLMLFGHEFTVHRLLMADMWAERLFGQASALYAFTMAAAYFFLLAGWLMCMVTAWGLRRNQGWARWTGMAMCVMSLPWFPIFTTLGVAGLYFLSRMPEKGPVERSPGQMSAAEAAKRCQDYWTAKRQSWLQPLIIGVFTLIGLNTLSLAASWARRMGMPRFHWGVEFWVWFSVFLLLQTAIHELGHACMAWAAYSRVKVLSIGPMTIARDEFRFQFHFDWRLLFHSGGYMGAVVTSDQNVRLKQIATIAAGPAASLLNGLVFLAVFFSLPGTSWQQYWWIAATNAMLGILYGVSNLIPVGYSDGSMLFHLIFNTGPGRILLYGFMAEWKREEARAHHDRADYDKEVEVKRAILERAIEAGKGNEMTIAACHQTLGHALLASDDWPAAEAQFRRCLAFEAECAANTALAGNAYSGFQKACTERQNVREAGLAYAAAVRVLKPRKQDRDRMGQAVTCAILAQAHLWAASFERVLEEVGESLRNVVPAPERLMLRAMLLSARTKAHLRLGRVEEGLADAEATVETLSSAAMPEKRRNLAWAELAGLGKRLWEAGQPAAGIARTRDGIARLEAGGAAVTAARYRIGLSGMLRQLGQLDEAADCLPEEGSLPPRLQRALLAERAQLNLSRERADKAVADCRRLVELWRSEAESVECAAEVAAAEGLLARACLEHGENEEAEALARNAAEVLGRWGHPEAAGCMVTATLARAEATGEWEQVAVDEARRVIESALLLSPAQKARMLKEQTVRLGRREAAAAAVAGD